MPLFPPVPLNVAGGGTGLTALTAHDLIIGNGTSPATLLAPSATSGVPLISQGASADPVFGTVVVAGGGTGLVALTAHTLIIGNGTSAATLLAPSATAGVPLVSAGSSADPAYGQLDLSSSSAVKNQLAVANGGTGVATANAATFFAGPTSGSAAAPSFRALQTPTVQVFGSSTTYNKPAGLLWARITVIGSGGGGGGGDNLSGGAGGGGGGGGGTAVRIVAAGSIGATETVTIGAAGNGGSSGNPGNNGSAGATCSFGSLASATGGGLGTGATSVSAVGTAGAGGIGSSGTLNMQGGSGMSGTPGVASVASGSGGVGGSTTLGGGGLSGSFSIAGGGGGAYGGGGGGGGNGQAGGAGASGVVIVEEFYQ